MNAREIYNEAYSFLRKRFTPITFSQWVEANCSIRGWGEREKAIARIALISYVNRINRAHLTTVERYLDDGRLHESLDQAIHFGDKVKIPKAVIEHYGGDLKTAIDEVIYEAYTGKEVNDLLCKFIIENNIEE